MTADGEIYIDGDCTETFREELDTAFGKDRWKIYDKPFMEFWDMNLFPLRVDVLIQDIDTDEIIGNAVITSKPIVIEDIGGRHIDLEPEGIEIRKL